MKKKYLEKDIIITALRRNITNDLRLKKENYW